jgi:hypothetical protein
VPNSDLEPIIANEQPRDVFKPHAGTVPNFNFAPKSIVAKDDPKMRRRPAKVAVPADGDSLGKIIGALTSQTALLVGVLYYFGWTRTHAMFDYFGVDTSLIGYGIPDYVLHSVDAAFPPFICTALIALIVLGIHRLAIRRVLNMSEGSRIRDRIQFFIIAMHVIGIFLALLAITGLLMPDRVGEPLGILAPVSLIVSVTLLGYVTYLNSTYPKELVQSHRPAQRTEPLDQDAEAVANQSSAPRRGKWLVAALQRMRYMRLAPRVAPHSRVQGLVLLVLGLLGMMWAVSLYANQVGTTVAAQLAADLPYKPPVVIYSTERIAIAGSGVKDDEITQPGNKYHYKYSGLRLLIHSTDRYILRLMRKSPEKV